MLCIVLINDVILNLLCVWIFFNIHFGNVISSGIHSHLFQTVPHYSIDPMLNQFFVLFVYLFSFFCFHLILMQIVKRGLNTNFLQDHLLAKYIMNNSRSQLHPVSYTQSIPLRFFHTLMGLKLPHFHKIRLLEFGDDKIGQGPGSSEKDDRQYLWDLTLIGVLVDSSGVLYRVRYGGHY